MKLRLKLRNFSTFENRTKVKLILKSDLRDYWVLSEKLCSEKFTEILTDKNRCSFFCFVFTVIYISKYPCSNLYLIHKLNINLASLFSLQTQSVN